MKLASVGLENLPNVYIDSISIGDTSRTSNSGLNTAIELSINDTIDKTWSSDLFLSKFMKIVI